jgi:hypothetical protein
MNGDGKPDVIVTSGNSGIISIFKNTTIPGGIISFSPKEDVTMFGHADYIMISDVDKDGKPDIITSNFSNNSVSILRNSTANGILSFENRLDYGAGVNPLYVTTGDLNGDGKPDIAVTNFSSGTISVFKNNSISGNVSLESAINYSSGSINPKNVSIGDLDGNGKLDMVATSGNSGLLSVLQNTYTGTNFSFGANVNFNVGINNTAFVSIGDLDGDGKPELVTSNGSGYDILILKNKVSEPHIDSVSITTATNGTTVTISGSKFSETTAVEFGGIPAASFTIKSATKIDATIGGGASGNITVTTPYGTGTIGGFNFVPTVTAGGPTTFCSGDVVLTLTSSASANNQWYKDGVILNSATAKTLTVNTSGNYTVKTTSNGITTSSTGIAVTVITVPTPGITLDANHNLISSAPTGNQWYLNGNLIPGATAQKYQPVQGGTYTVQVTSNNCLSDYSSGYSFVVTGIIDLGNNEYIKLYPNPVRDNLNVSWRIAGAQLMNIEVNDLSGKQIIINKSVHNGEIIDLSNLSQGIYYIRIYNNQRKTHYTVKILKGI